MLAANLHVSSVSIVDANGNPAPSPAVGLLAYVRLDLDVDLPTSTVFSISGTMYGFTNTFQITLQGTFSTFFYATGATIKHGAATASAQVDPENAVPESDESDNSGSVNFTPTQLPLPSKFIQPLGGTAFRNYGYVNYVDQDPTSGFADYRGGPYTYDTHDAIDMTEPSFTAMDSGVPVMAAAAGTVIDLADGNYDRNQFIYNNANYVAIDHGNGWQTYYYHLREGSVGVKVGQTVSQGQVIGMVGSSGASSATHLHFAVYNGDAVETYKDPFTYWRDPLPYQGDVDQIVDAGVTNANPTSILNVEERPPEMRTFTQASGQTVWGWMNYYARANLAPNFTLYRPNGTVFSTTNYTAASVPNRGGYSYFSMALPASPDPGTWQVGYSIGGVELRRESFTVTAAGGPAAQVEQGTTYILTAARPRSTAARIRRATRRRSRSSRSRTSEPRR